MNRNEPQYLVLATGEPNLSNAAAKRRQCLLYFYPLFIIIIRPREDVRDSKEAGVDVDDLKRLEIKTYVDHEHGELTRYGVQSMRCAHVLDRSTSAGRAACSSDVA